MHRRTEQDPRTAFLGGRTRLRLPRVPTRLALLGLLVITLTVAAAPLVGAQPSQDGQTPPPTPKRGHVDVLEVSGLFDRVLVDFVEHQLHVDADQGAVAVVLQLNSRGAVLDHGRFEPLVRTVRDSPVPVDVWVGPSGSQAVDEATELLAAARTTGVAPGSHIEVTRALLGDRSLGGRAAIGDDVSAGEARDLKLVDNAAPVIGQFVLGLPGVESKVV